MSNPSEYKSPPRYQKDINVKAKKITDDYMDLYRILKNLPKDKSLLDIAAAEGFIASLALRAGFEKVTAIEIGKEKVNLGKKQFKGLNIVCGDIFSNLDLIDKNDIFVVSKFFHNIGEEYSDKLMAEFTKKECMVIVRHKPGLKKENGTIRQPLATRKGIQALFNKWKFYHMSFTGNIVIGTNGAFKALVEGIFK